MKIMAISYIRLLEDTRDAEWLFNTKARRRRGDVSFPAEREAK